jgi:hypothetical protein
MDNDNASILTAACSALERYRGEERELERELARVQTRLELTREFIEALSGKTRAPRRSRQPVLVEKGQEALLVQPAELMPVA